MGRRGWRVGKGKGVEGREEGRLQERRKHIRFMPPSWQFWKFCSINLINRQCSDNVIWGGGGVFLPPLACYVW